MNLFRNIKIRLTWDSRKNNIIILKQNNIFLTHDKSNSVKKRIRCVIYL